MEFNNLSIPDVILIKPDVFTDHRGFFMESYNKEKYYSAGVMCEFVQDNYVKSIKDTLRGLHFQNKFPQAKLVSCLKGAIFDVAVDIRKESQFYGQWIAEELSENNKKQLFIPSGFAHGYYVLSDTAEIAYKCSNIYNSDDQCGIIWNDPEIDIKWPNIDPILSDKDNTWPGFVNI